MVGNPFYVNIEFYYLCFNFMAFKHLLDDVCSFFNFHIFIIKENTMKIKEEWKNKSGMYVCPFCKNDYSKKGIGTHIWKKHTEEGKNFNANIISYNNGRMPWQLGKNKDNCEGLNKISKKLKKYYENNKSTFYGRKHTKEAKEKIRKAAIKNELGGHTSKRSIYYKKKNDDIIYLQSSYEEKVARELDKNNIIWERPKYLKYIDKENIEHRYYPDFYLIDYNIYLDPKNYYLQKKDKEKINLVKKQNNVNIIILSENELEWKIIKNMVL